MSARERTRSERAASVLVRLASLLARKSLREELEEEWQAELEHGAERGYGSLRLVGTALGSFRDAALTHVLPSHYRRGHRRGESERGGFLRDVRYAGRLLRRSPGFTVVVLATVALGVGANTALFSVIRGVLLDPLPFPDSERVEVVWGWHPEIGREAASAPDFADWRAQARSFSSMAALYRQNVVLGGSRPERVIGARVTHGFFELLRVEPLLGRWPSAEEDAPGAEPVVVLSHALWQTRFGGDSSVVGRTIEIQGGTAPVIGIAPPGLVYPRRAALWQPARLDLDQLGRRSDFLLVLGRLADGVGPATAERELQTIAARLQAEYPATNARWSVELQPILDLQVGEVRTGLWLLLGAVGFVLLIACANVANLMIARVSSRREELELRSALGASAGALARQVLVEALLVAALGGVAGVALAFGALRALRSLGPAIPRLDNVSIDPAVLLFSVSLSLASGLVFGLLPTLHAIAGARLRAPKGGRAGRGSRSRMILASGQMALAVVLLVGAGLMLRSFEALSGVDPGFRVEGLTTASVYLPPESYPDERMSPFFAELGARLRAEPEISAASLVSAVPLDGGVPYLGFGREGQTLDDGAVQDAQVLVVAPGYFETLGLPLLRGRVLDHTDHAEAPATAVISRTMAERTWGSDDPVGSRITLADPIEGPWITVVGVVGDTRQDELAEKPYPQLYLPLAQTPTRRMAIVARSELDAEALAPRLRAALAGLDPELPLFNLASARQIVSEALARPRSGSLLIAAFALSALVLAAIGLYGVLSMLVGERLPEIGVRMTLGASRSRVIGEVASRGLALLGAGALLGVVAALGIARLLATLWFEVRPGDPVTLIAVLVTLGLVGALAIIGPAVRASRVDPMRTLRTE